MKKEKIKNIVLIIVVAVISSTITSFATSNYLYDSVDVKYDNSNGVQAETVQGAIDELYSCASDYSGIDTRVTSLESYFKNSPTSYFDAHRLDVGIKNSDRSYINLYSNNLVRGTIGVANTGVFSIYAKDSNGDTNGTLDLKGNPVMINGRELTVHGCYSYTGTVASNGYLTVQHNLNISGSYYPVVSIGMDTTNAMIPYNINSVGSTSFRVGIVRIDGYTMSSASNYSVQIYWCY